MDLDQATNRTRNAAIATVLIAFLGTINWNHNSDSPAEKLTEGVVVISLQVAAWALYKNSRTTATFVFLVTLWLVGSTVIRDRQITYLPIGVTFLYLYFQGVRSAFAYHRLRKQAESTY